MVRFASIALFSLLSFASAAPLQKRIAQVISESTAKWEKACLAAGGGDRCNPISQLAFMSLLAAGKNCDQQDAADQTGNLPLGVKAVSPPGSCPAKPDGPVPDGAQLNTLVKNPRASGSDSAPAPASPKPSKGKSGPEKTKPSKKEASKKGASSAPSAAAPSAEPSAASTVSDNAKVSGDFHLQNGKDAIALNAKFATLTSSSSCTDGDQACVDSGFAQCVGGKFVTTQCGSGLTCAALPLVNKPGTSITCTTEADVKARIAATGA